MCQRFLFLLLRRTFVRVCMYVCGVCVCVCGMYTCVQVLEETRRGRWVAECPGAAATQHGL